MNKYNGLLQKISQQYNIKKGKHERDERWKTRIVYSICGLMAYASLWDRDEEGDGVSIIHVNSSLQLLSRLLIAPSQCLQSLEQCA